MSQALTVTEGMVYGGIEYVKANETRKGYQRDEMTYPFNAIVVGERQRKGLYDFLSLNGPTPKAERIQFCTLRKGKERFFLTQGVEDGSALVNIRGTWSTPTLMKLEDRPCPMQGKMIASRCSLCGSPEYCGAHSWEERYPFEDLSELNHYAWDQNSPKSGLLFSDYCFEGAQEMIVFLAEPIEIRLPGWGFGSNDVRLEWDGKNMSYHQLLDRNLNNSSDVFRRQVNLITGPAEIVKTSTDGKLLVVFYDATGPVTMFSYLDDIRGSFKFRDVRFGFCDTSLFPEFANRPLLAYYENGQLVREVAHTNDRDYNSLQSEMLDACGRGVRAVPMPK